MSRNILEARWRAFSDHEQFDVIGHLNEIRSGDDDAYDTASKLLEILATSAAAEPEDEHHFPACKHCGATICYGACPCQSAAAELEAKEIPDLWPTTCDKHPDQPFPCPTCIEEARR